MICRDCAEAAKAQRHYLKTGNALRKGGRQISRKHPKNCGCPCMHKPAEKWEKQFSVPEPISGPRKIEDTKPL